MKNENIHQIINDYLKEKSDYIKNIAEQTKEEIINAFEKLLSEISEIISHITYINESKIKFRKENKKENIWFH